VRSRPGSSAVGGIKVGRKRRKEKRKGKGREEKKKEQ
jgi:hypothetical protein